MPARAQFISIQYLRGVAALAVVVYHTEGQLRRMGYLGWWPEGRLTGAGVDLFFVISGFIMWVTTADGSVTPRQFIQRRIARIVPLYWLFTTVVVLTALVMPQALQTVRFEPLHAVASYLFIPYPAADGQLFPILIPGWTLNYEMLFYAIFALCLLVGSPLLRLASLAAVLVALTITGYMLHPQVPALAFWTNSIVLEFLFGVLIAWGMGRVSKPLMLAGLAAVLLAGYVAARAAMEVPKFVELGIPAAIIVLAAAALEQAGKVPSWRLPKLIGDASYSLYLSHTIFLSAFGQLWRKLPVLSTTLAGQMVFVVAAIVLSTALGILVHVFIERPLGRLARRRRPAAPSATAVV